MNQAELAATRAACQVRESRIGRNAYRRVTAGAADFDLASSGVGTFLRSGIQLASAWPVRRVDRYCGQCHIALMTGFANGTLVRFKSWKVIFDTYILATLAAELDFHTQ
jgi:hypothetical protein